jgi:protocatechuate 3,4-dioxygenase beta subunit
MERKDFLRNSMGIIGIGSIIPILNACHKDEVAATTTDTTSGSSSSGSCTVSATETDGPYPLYTSRGSSIQRVSIADTKTGLPLSITLTIVNVNDSCNVLSNARVDIWHCDKDGYYSGYVNSGYLGTQDNTSAVFCRGLQYSDTSGQVKFTSIYPGWYTGRITHIHAQVYVNSVLKLTTQFAFPDAINTAVYKTALYSTHGQNTSVTANTGDSVFSDSLTSGHELANVVANATTGGYDLTHTIYVSA